MRQEKKKFQQLFNNLNLAHRSAPSSHFRLIFSFFFLLLPICLSIATRRHRNLGEECRNDLLFRSYKHLLASESNQNRLQHIFWKRGNSSDSHESDIDTLSVPPTDSGQQEQQQADIGDESAAQTWQTHQAICQEDSSSPCCFAHLFSSQNHTGLKYHSSKREYEGPISFSFRSTYSFTIITVLLVGGSKTLPCLCQPFHYSYYSALSLSLTRLRLLSKKITTIVQLRVRETVSAPEQKC